MNDTINTHFSFEDKALEDDPSELFFDPESDVNDNELRFKVSESGERIDSFLASNTEYTRTFAANLCEKECVFVNGKKAKKNTKLSSGDIVTVLIPESEAIDASPENIPIDIVYEDDDLLVVDKPKGMVVHPAPGNHTGTLVNALLYHCEGRLSGINGKMRPGIVHRIDKDTKGLLIVAKNDFAHNGLAEQIKTHSFSRRYHAVLYGTPKEETGTLRCGIGRAKNDRKKMAVYPVGTPNTKEAVSDYKVLLSGGGISYCEFILHTGRTHQIRLHSLMMGHPVVGDPVYGQGRDMMGIKGQALTAYHIGFIHPRTGKEIVLQCPDGEEIDKLRSYILRHNNDNI